MFQRVFEKKNFSCYKGNMEYKIQRYSGRNKGDESEGGNFQIIKVAWPHVVISSPIQYCNTEKKFSKSESQYIQILMGFQHVFWKSADLKKRKGQLKSELILSSPKRFNTCGHQVAWKQDGRQGAWSWDWKEKMEGSRRIKKENWKVIWYIWAFGK